MQAFALPPSDAPRMPEGPDSLAPGVTREVAYYQPDAAAGLVVVVRFGAGAESSVPGGLSVRRAFAGVPSDLEHDDVYVSALPLAAGRRADFLDFAAELDGPRNPELVEHMAHAAHGEVVFLQPGTPDLVIPVVVGDRPWRDEHRMAAGDDAFNTWVNSRLVEMHDIDFGVEAPPANELLWDVRVD